MTVATITAATASVGPSGHKRPGCCGLLRNRLQVKGKVARGYTCLALPAPLRQSMRGQSRRLPPVAAVLPVHVHIVVLGIATAQARGQPSIAREPDCAPIRLRRPLVKGWNAGILLDS